MVEGGSEVAKRLEKCCRRRREREEEEEEEDRLTVSFLPPLSFAGCWFFFPLYCSATVIRFWLLCLLGLAALLGVCVCVCVCLRVQHGFEEEGRK